MIYIRIKTIITKTKENDENVLEYVVWLPENGYKKLAGKRVFGVGIWPCIIPGVGDISWKVTLSYTNRVLLALKFVNACKNKNKREGERKSNWYKGLLTIPW